jgi:hypothetical protein
VNTARSVVKNERIGRLAVEAPEVILGDDESERNATSAYTERGLSGATDGARKAARTRASESPSPGKGRRPEWPGVSAKARPVEVISSAQSRS